MKSSNSESQPDQRQDSERRPEGRGPVFIGSGRAPSET